MSKEKRMATAQESFVAFFSAESKGEANDRDRFDERNYLVQQILFYQKRGGSKK